MFSDLVVLVALLHCLLNGIVFMLDLFFYLAEQLSVDLLSCTEVFCQNAVCLTKSQRFVSSHRL